MRDGIVPVYFPWDDQRHDQFCLLFDLILNAINPNTQIVVGGDINVRRGTRTCDEHKQVLGPHRISRSNTQRKNLLQVLASHNLRVENTFFNQSLEEYVTYTSIHMDHHPRCLQHA
jgi:hypothetical protein